MRKRICSFVFLASLLLCCFPHFAAADSSGLVFSMDISGYSADNQVVKNGVTDSSADITIHKYIRDKTNERSGPVLEEYLAPDGTTISYLSFADDSLTDATDYSEYLGAVRLGSSLMSSLLAGSEEMTVEFWARPYTPGQNYGRAFSYASDKNGNNTDMAWQVASTSNDNVTVDAAGYLAATTDTAAKTLSTTIVTAKNEWHYYAISRRWTTTDAGTGAGKWEYIVFVDGNVVENTSKEGVYKNTLANYGELTIGGKKHPTLNRVYNPFDGGISEFNIYNKMLSADTLTAHYNSGKSLYLTPVKQILAEEDMTAFTVGSSPVGTEMFTQSRGTENDMSDLTVREAQSTDGTKTIQYIEISNGGTAAKDTYYGHRFSPAFSESFVLDVNLQLVGLSPSSRAIRWGKNTIIHDLRAGITAQTDEFGFHNLRYLFIMGDDGKYDMTCIDLLSGETVATREDIAATCEYILCQQFDTPGNEKYLNVSKFKVFRYTVPEVVASNTDSLTLDDDTVSIEFSEELDAETVTENAFVLTNTNKGKAVKIGAVAYDAGTKIVTCKLREYLDAENSYKLEIKGIKDLDGFSIADGTAIEFTMGQDTSAVTGVVFKNAAGQAVTELGTAQNIGAAISVYNASGESKSYTAFLLLCDSGGTVVDIETGEGSGKGSVPITVNLTGNATVSNGYHAKCFVWENTSNGYKILQEEPIVLN